MNEIALMPFFTPQETVNANPLFFPWNPIPVQWGQFVNLHAPVPLGLGEIGALPERTSSFTKISNASLMIFPEDEDKKYIYLCPVTLLKSSFDLWPAINSALVKFAVVMTPTLH
ncbi:putative phospholipase A1-Igamma3, chloroplastic-like [Capsicum annuum]|nr:putative phospholipase A1-Igamma3, chloroplastic-like [Capsicum annuum]KAF3678975.1 putative phospholipase A1-Igamma3, chloroplastic-like [Capsicum annuum]